MITTPPAPGTRLFAVYLGDDLSKPHARWEGSRYMLYQIEHGEQSDLDLELEGMPALWWVELGELRVWPKPAEGWMICEESEVDGVAQENRAS
jgi:hypothetical protein